MNAAYYSCSYKYAQTGLCPLRFFLSCKILCSMALPAEYFLHLPMLEQSGHQESEAWEISRYKWLLELGRL